MVQRNDAIEMTEREQEILLHQKMIDHARHQRRVGTITKLRRQELSHSEYVVRFAHYMQRPRPFSAAKWVAELRASDFRAYQSKLADIDIREHEAYMWWFRLGDEQRYSLIRSSMGAIRDEHEQEERQRRKERLKRQRESGEI